MKTPLNTLGTALTGLTLAARALAVEVVDFELDAGGDVPNGFVSASSPYVSFSDTLGENLSIYDLHPETIGNSLAVFSDDESSLLMTFTEPITSLSVSFGNDDLNFTLPDDTGVLLLFNGMTLLETLSVEVNQDDALNQTISWVSSGTSATSAEFYYGDVSLNPIFLNEVVDNITFTLESIPEPSTYAAVVFAGVAATVAWRRRKRG